MLSRSQPARGPNHGFCRNGCVDYVVKSCSTERALTSHQESLRQSGDVATDRGTLRGLRKTGAHTMAAAVLHTEALSRESEERTAQRLAESEERMLKHLADSEGRAASLLAQSEERMLKSLAESHAQSAALIRESEARTAVLIRESEARTAAALEEALGGPVRELLGSAFVARMAGASVSALSDKHSVYVLRVAGFPATEMREAGYTAAELAEAGFIAADLKAGVYYVEELKAAGFTAQALWQVGFPADVLYLNGARWIHDNAADLSDCYWEMGEVLWKS